MLIPEISFFFPRLKFSFCCSLACAARGGRTTRPTSLSFLILICYTKQVAEFRKCGKPATCVSTWKLGLQVTTELA